ncbi:hypothetical protein DL93DRAFT_811459 [Clavulina sp. PMI_390]|nr:hypothetical protein DL93DRAFT_811459 [Clavulina sp. PMI_390]
MNAVEIASSDSSSSSRHGSSSPGASPSRSSTPSQSSASSDFLPSDNVPLTPWTPYVKPEPSGLFDDDMKPSFDAAYYGIGMPEHGGFHGPSPRGMLLEDLMQEDAYESAPFDSMLHQSTTPATPTVIPAFEPALPNLPAYPSPSPSTSEASPQPSTVQVPASQATVRQTSARGQGSIKPDVRHAFESSSLQTLLVTTPNASCPNAPIQSPPRHSVSSLPILIHNVPAVGAKSRVETQIKMTLDLAAPHDGMAAYDRIGSWKWLRLPKGTSTRRRPRKEPKIGMQRSVFTCHSFAVAHHHFFFSFNEPVATESTSRSP